MLSNIRVSFYEKLEPLVPTIFHKYRSGDLLARIVGDVEAITEFLFTCFLPAGCITISIFLYDFFNSAFFQ